MPSETVLLAAAAKLATSLATAAGKYLLADLLKKDSHARAFKFAVSDTLKSYQSSNRTPSNVVEALLLNEGPLHHDKARAELIKLLDVAEQPSVSVIAGIWKTAVADPTAEVNYHEETERLLKALSDHLWRTNEFREYMNSRGIRNLVERDTSEKYKPELSNSLEGIYPAFYFPLQLGRLNRNSERSQSRDERHSDPLEFPLAWQEARVSTSRWRYEREAADSVWKKIKDRMHGIFVILGEPGAGKSKLLQHWFAQTNPGSAQLIRLRNLGQVPQVDQSEHSTLWLLDGWDELARDRRRAAEVNALPGVKIVTCRTAAYQGEFDSYLDNTPVHYIMGMLPNEQRNFLFALVSTWNSSQHTHLIRSGLADIDQSWAEKLWKSVQAHNNIRILAGNPLLLTLLAIVSPPGRAMQLPEDRAAFYQNAYDYLCKNRHPAGIDSLAYSITQQWLVNAVGSSRVHRNTEIPCRVLDDAYGQLEDKDTARFTIDNLRDVALTSGLLKDFGTHYEFLHLTFQEWGLAQFFQQSEGFQTTVERYWDNADYFEVLALLWSMSTSADREAATRFLMKAGYRVHKNGEKESTASGLRTMLHLWSQSGVGLPENLGSLFDEVRQRCTNSHLIKIAIALDDRSPVELLRIAASDPNNSIRRTAARNRSTPANVLSLLGCDPESDVRKHVAKNLNTPVEVLMSLARDSNKDVRRVAARNPNTLTDVLTLLACDPEINVRRTVAQNLNTPVEVLTSLARDSNKDVRRVAARNPNTLTDVLTLLACNPEINVRRTVAQNLNTPVEVLMSLARDWSVDVRRFVASNPNTPADVLSLLSCESNTNVRRAVARNPNTPTDVLTLWASSLKVIVRISAAQNPNTPTHVLTSLARDPEINVRRTVARNPSASVDVLSLLGSDPKIIVCRTVARNPNTLADVLTSCASSLKVTMRISAAQNPNTPVVVLTSLTSDPNDSVRWSVATNPSTPLELL